MLFPVISTEDIPGVKFDIINPRIEIYIKCHLLFFKKNWQKTQEKMLV